MLLTIASARHLAGVDMRDDVAFSDRAIGVEPLRIALTASPPPRNGTRTQSAPLLAS